MSVAIVAAGGANLASLRCALQRMGADAELTTARAAIRAATHVILPGVGAAAPAMARLQSLDLVDTLRGLVQPVLGVCLGMQLLCAHSDEGDVDCLGVIDAPVRRLAADDARRVPHSGWNEVSARDPHRGSHGQSRGWAYFVHSYAVPVCDATLATCDYGGEFSAEIGHRNFLGVQYHPERSATLGAAVLRAFLAT